MAVLRQKPITAYICPRCDVGFETQGELQNHQDWHLAKDIHDEERSGPTYAKRSAAPPPRTSGSKGAATGSSKRTTRGGSKADKADQGQTKLRFG